MHVVLTLSYQKQPQAICVNLSTKFQAWPVQYFTVMQKSTRQLWEKAQEFIFRYSEEEGQQDTASERLRDIKKEIDGTGSYTHTFEELQAGARMAWRNSTRCIGRLFWKGLAVRDMRHLSTATEVKNACFEHLEKACNGGKILPLITVFAPLPADGPAPVRIWNHQLTAYAGYRQRNGQVTGDTKNAELTAICQQLGWTGGRNGRFDLLPLLVQTNGGHPQVFSMPRGLVKEVPLEHPEFEWFASLGLKWYAVPVISDMLLEVGGIQYPAAPFSGWYMGTEIGARNLADTDRYNMLPAIARGIGLNTSHNASLWKDRTLVELNIAVLHSFARAGVKIADHHTAAEEFERFEKQEKKRCRHITAEWSWIIPPVSPATTGVFHKEYDNRELPPNFFCQLPAWHVAGEVTACESGRVQG